MLIDPFHVCSVFRFHLMDNAYSWNIPFYLPINHYVFYNLYSVTILTSDRNHRAYCR